MLFSFLPHRAIKRIFPPIVCGVTIVLIGINLVGVGIKAWGGGAFCAGTRERCWGVAAPVGRVGGRLQQRQMPHWPGIASRGMPLHPTPADHTEGLFIPLNGCAVINSTTGVATPVADGCFKNIPITCSNNGDVKLPYGHGVYVGLGFSVFSFIVILELFGSPFLRNCEVVVALLFG